MKKALDRIGVVSSADILPSVENSPSSRIKMAGIVLKKRERVSAKGNRFAFMQVSDTSGVYEVMIFSEALSAARDFLSAGETILMTIDVDIQNENEIRLVAQKIEKLAPYVEGATKKIRVILNTADAVVALRNTLDYNNTAGNDNNDLSSKKLELLAKLPEQKREVRIKLPGSWAINSKLKNRIRNIDGVLDVQEL